MAFQDMINSFQAILNRDDCSSTQAQAFLQQGIGRIQREARLPSMERQVVVTPTTPIKWIAVPNDLLQIIDVIVPDQQGVPRALKKRTYRELLRVDPYDLPWCYARFQAQIFIAGTVPGPSTASNTIPTVTLLYYGQFTPFASLTADNELSVSAPDLAVYAGLSYAADTYQHPSKQAWEATYQQVLADVQGLAIDLEMTGGPMVVQPLYGYGDHST